MKDGIFYLGLGLLCSHELDAMPNHEWRVLPLLSSLEDSIGQVAFVIAHVPLFAIVIGLVASLNPDRRALSRRILALFLVVHVLLHLALSGHQHYEFDSFLSLALIFGSGVCGAIYLALDRFGAKADAA